MSAKSNGKSQDPPQPRAQDRLASARYTRDDLDVRRHQGASAGTYSNAGGVQFRSATEFHPVRSTNEEFRYRRTFDSATPSHTGSLLSDRDHDDLDTHSGTESTLTSAYTTGSDFSTSDYSLSEAYSTTEPSSFSDTSLPTYSATPPQARRNLGTRDHRPYFQEDLDTRTAVSPAQYSPGGLRVGSHLHTQNSRYSRTDKDRLQVARTSSPLSHRQGRTQTSDSSVGSNDFSRDLTLANSATSSPSPWPSAGADEDGLVAVPAPLPSLETLPSGVKRPPLRPGPSSDQPAETKRSEPDGSAQDITEPKRGGYDAEFDPPLDPKNRCNICEFALCEPQQTDPCGHRFCRTCLDTIMNFESPKCPVPDCRELIKNAHPDNFCRREVLNSNVRCSNSIAGCPWKGPLRSLKEHLQGCTFSVVACGNQWRGCKMMLQRSKLQSHMEHDCPYREDICPYCDKKLLFAEIEKHINDSCEAVDITCDCGKTLRRQLLSSHLVSECPVAEQECDFASVGCKHKAKRSELSEHKGGAVVEHIDLLHGALVQKDDQMRQLEKDYRGLRKMFEDVLDELGMERQARRDLEARVSSLDSQVMHLKALEGKVSDLDRDVRNIRKSGVGGASEEHLKRVEERLDDVTLRAAQADAKAVTASQNADALRTRTTSMDHQLTSINQIIGRTDAVLAEFDLRILSQETTSFNSILVWKIPDYNRHFEEARSGKKPSLYSPPFFTSRHGYKMCARVYLNGDGVGKHSHMSVFFVVMRGEFDSLLPWPFHQKVTLTLLDQSTAKKHISDTFLPDPNSSSFQRPTSEMNIASGCPRFVSQETLRLGLGYVKDNTIFIRIAVDTTGLANY